VAIDETALDVFLLFASSSNFLGLKEISFERMYAI
jgi:hypothetical protein